MLVRLIKLALSLEIQYHTIVIAISSQITNHVVQLLSYNSILLSRILNKTHKPNHKGAHTHEGIKHIIKQSSN